MNMNFVVLSRLLSLTQSLLLSGYLAFTLTITTYYIQSFYTWQSIVLLVIAFFLCLIHHYLYARIKLDADLIDLFAKQSDSSQINHLTSALDQSLVLFKLIPEHKTGRNWNLRFQGCLKIFKIQILITVLQYLFLLMIIINNIT